MFHLYILQLVYVTVFSSSRNCPMSMKKKFIEAIRLTNWNAICHELWLILCFFFKFTELKICIIDLLSVASWPHTSLNFFSACDILQMICRAVYKQFLCTAVSSNDFQLCSLTLHWKATLDANNIYPSAVLNAIVFPS